jgi:hypothetical protein
MAEFRRGSSRRSGTILLSAVRIAMNALDRFRSQLRDVFGDGPGRESGIMLLQQLDGSDPLPLGWALAANRLTLQRSHELAAPFVEDASVTQCNEPTIRSRTFMASLSFLSISSHAVSPGAENRDVVASASRLILSAREISTWCELPEQIGVVARPCPARRKQGPPPGC